MAFIPLALQMLPLIPGLVDSVMRVVDAVKSDPQTPEEMAQELDALSARLREVVERVQAVRLPAPPPPTFQP